MLYFKRSFCVICLFEWGGFVDFCQRFDGLIVERGLNALRLSKEIGVADRLIGAWRKGEKRPGLDNLVLLADFFDVSLDYLVGRSDVREVGTKKEPAPVISGNGQEMLALYERLPEREQILLLGRLQEMAAPLLGEGKGGQAAPGSSEGKAV